MLYNRIDSKILRKSLEEENFQRTTISFYRYVMIGDTEEMRDQLYREWDALNCFGRIYLAHEGINAQMSIPEANLSAFLEKLDQIPEFSDMPIKYAVEDDGKSFFKLIIKTRKKILADGQDDDAYDVSNVGKHLSALEFHELSKDGENLIIDIRNRYESEIGHFEGAVCPEADTFRDEITMVADMFHDQKEKKVLLYCTGGIRCEKASAFLKHKGFKDVNQLHGGVIEYARQVKKLNLESRFIGKNFVFDNRMGERISDQVISSCHRCGEPCDQHVNCANDACHLLFIQCKYCAEKNNHCCSDECKSFIELSNEEQKRLRKDRIFNGTENGYRGLRVMESCQL